jgi:hypothetical protein
MIRTNAAADNLMLTQGWRRFRDGKDILFNQLSTFSFLPE